MRYDYKMPEWAIRQIRRSNGLIEDICEHGCGHPNMEYLERNCVTDKEYETMSIHGCCGCCYKPPVGKDKL